MNGTTVTWHKATAPGRAGDYWVRNSFDKSYRGSIRDALALDEKRYKLFCAYHEAGHAVLSMLAGEYVHALELHPGGGRIYFERFRAFPWGSMLAAAGGERASDRWLREADAWTPLAAAANEISAAGDRHSILAAHSYVGFGPSAPLDYSALQDAADERLEAHWERVAAVAHELADRRILAGDVAAKLAGLTNGRRLTASQP